MFARKVSPVYFDNLIATCRASVFSPRVLHEVRSVASQIALSAMARASYWYRRH
jgi:hypothetical protein